MVITSRFEHISTRNYRMLYSLVMASADHSSDSVSSFVKTPTQEEVDTAWIRLTLNDDGWTALRGYLCEEFNAAIQQKVDDDRVVVKKSLAEKLRANRAYRREYNSRPEVVEKRRAYYNRKDVQERRARYSADPLVKQRKRQKAKEKRALVGTLFERFPDLRKASPDVDDISVYLR